MQEGKAEGVTPLLFFHFVRISTPRTPKTRLAAGGEENARSQQLARAGGRAVAGRAGASGAALHARRQAGGLGPAEEEETLGLGGAGGAAGRPGEGERRPGRRRREVPAGPARVRPDARLAPRSPGPPGWPSPPPPPAVT